MKNITFKALLLVLAITLASATSCGCQTMDCPTCTSSGCQQACPPPVCVDTPDICVPQIKPPTICPPKIQCPTYCPPPPPTIKVCDAPLCPTPCAPKIHINVPNQPIRPQIPIIVAPPRPTGPIILPPNLPTPPPSPTKPNKYTLKFSFACRKDVAFESCKGNVIWNDVVVYSINPTDYSIHTKTIVVYAKVGENSLSLEGAGSSDSFGLIMDNIRLIDVYNVNIVKNGGFSVPNINGFDIQIPSNVPYWEGPRIEIGDGQIYITGYGANQVVELDSTANDEITQRFTFDKYFNLVANGVYKYGGEKVTFWLEFNWALRNVGINNIQSSQAVVVINDKLVLTLRSTGGNNGVNHVKVQVKLIKGTNELHFDGTSFSDSFGVSIDNVSLYHPSDNYNWVKNGGFENPNVGGFVIINGGVQGWKGDKMEIGKCTLYNSAWPAGQQCAELGSDSNQRYTAFVHLCDSTFIKYKLAEEYYYGKKCINAIVYDKLGYANQQIDDHVDQTKKCIYYQIKYAKKDFEKYIKYLYEGVCSKTMQIKDCAADAILDIRKYDCNSYLWKKLFGSSNEPDFDCVRYRPQDLVQGKCKIYHVQGKNIYCKAACGRKYHLLWSKCSHLEGTSPYPKYGETLFFKGHPTCENGPIHLVKGSTCNCY